MSQDLQPKNSPVLDPRNAVTLDAPEDEIAPPSGGGEDDGGGSEDPDIDLDSLLAEDEAPSTPEPPKPDTPEFKALAKQFQEVMGIDLGEAFTQFSAVTAQMEAMQARIQESDSRDTLQALQDGWDVTPSELDRRVAQVLKVVGKMTPEQKARYDSLEGIQKLWGRIEGSKAKSAPASGGTKATQSTTDVPTFKTSDLRKMMLRDPELYNRQQGVIAAAYAAGRVTDD